MRPLHTTAPRPVIGISFGPKGKSLVAGGAAGFDLWNLTTGAQVAIPAKTAKYLYGWIYDPRERWLYVSDHRFGLRFVALDGSETPPVPGSPHDRHVTSFDLTRDGGRLVMSRGGYLANHVECWKVRPSGIFAWEWGLRDGKPLRPDDFPGGKWFTNAVAISRDGKTVAAAETRSSGGSGNAPLIVLRHGSTGKLIAELGKSAIWFSGRLAFGADRKAVFAWDESTLERWDIAKGKRTHQTAAPPRGHFQDIAVHPKGDCVITAGSDGHARTWNAADLAPVGALKCGIGKLNSLAVSDDGRLIAAGGNKGEVALWDFAG